MSVRIFSYKKPSLNARSLSSVGKIRCFVTAGDYVTLTPNWH